MKLTFVHPRAVVSISYALYDHEDGSLLDAATPDAPLRYVHGAGALLPAVEEALTDKKPRDVISLVLPPERAYGAHEPRRLQEVPRDLFPADLDLKPGMPFMLELAAGLHPMAFRVKKVTPDGTVVLDGNHPLAGKTLRFEITVEEVRWASPEEIKAGEPSPDELPDQEVFARVKRR